MQTVFVEACNVIKGHRANWGKFAVCRFEGHEWARRSVVEKEEGAARGLVAGQGWDSEHIWVLDLATGEGACFRPGGV